MIAVIESARAGLFARSNLLRNIVAGLVVGVIALPLAMAFAIASGAKPEQGIYTAIVAGLAASLFGGSRLQISGPTGAFIVILSGITARHGIVGLQIATLMAGLILVAMGLVKMGSVIKYIPDPVIIGFTTGIGVIIWVGQWKDFFGLHPAGGEHFHEKLWSLLSALPNLHFATTALALLSLAILIVVPRYVKKIPAPLVAMVVATLAQSLFGFDGVATIGSAFGGIPQTLPAFEVPTLSVSSALKLIGPAFTIALLGAIESLLSAVVADGMAGTRHDSNQELIGQGIANILSPLFGGFAATGAIARTAANIRNGGNSPLAGIVHAATLLAIILALAPLAAYIPLCTLAAILFVVAYNISEVRHFLHLLRTSPKADIGILLVTFCLTVFADLVVAVNVGVMLASLMFMQRMARAVQIQEDGEALRAVAETEELDLPPGTVVFNIEGPFFFAAAEKLERVLEDIHSHADTLILRMRHVPFVDATGIQALSEIIDDCRHFKTRLVICGMRKDVRRKLERANVLNKLDKGSLVSSMADFLRAEQARLERAGRQPGDTGSAPSSAGPVSGG